MHAYMRGIFGPLHEGMSAAIYVLFLTLILQLSN